MLVTMKCPEWRLICNLRYWLFKIIVWITSGKWETLDYIVCGFHFLFVSNLIKTELGRGDPWKLNWENFIALSTPYFVFMPLNATPHDRWLRRISRNQWCGIRRVLVYFFNHQYHFMYRSKAVVPWLSCSWRVGMSRCGCQGLRIRNWTCLRDCWQWSQY